MPFTRTPNRTPASTTLLVVLWIVLALSVSGCASRHYYDASREIVDNPADHGLEYETVTFSSRDGTELEAWFLPAVGAATATVVHFHGKSDNMSGHLDLIDWLPAHGFNVFLFDYRGFGESAGKPSPGRVNQDALAALDYVRSRPDLDPDRLLVFGQSLGGAIAISSVAEGESAGVRAVVTEASLSSYRLVVRDQIGKMGFWSFLKVPLSWLVTNNRYSPDKFVDRLAPIPLLLIHGTDDEGIPSYHCQRLHDRAGEPKQMWLVEGGKHLEAFTTHGGTYRQMLVDFFRDTLAEGGNPPHP